MAWTIGQKPTWDNLAGKPAILDDDQIAWDEITGMPLVWNESQIPDLSADKITSGTLNSDRIPSSFNSNRFEIRPTDSVTALLRLFPDDGTNTDFLRAELSFNSNNQQFQFRFNAHSVAPKQFIQADYNGDWARFGDDFDEIQFNGGYSKFSSTEAPTDSSSGAVRIPGIGIGNGIIFADGFVSTPVVKLSTPATLPAENGSIYYDNVNHDFLAIANGNAISLISGGSGAVSWNDLTDIPTVLADGVINYSELQNIPAQWDESQIPGLPISKITNLDSQLNSKSDTSHGHTSFPNPLEINTQLVIRNGNTSQAYVRVDNNNIHLLIDRDFSGGWDDPFPMSLNYNTNTASIFGSQVYTTSNFTPSNYFNLSAFNEITNYGSSTNSYESFAVKTPYPTVGYHNTSGHKWWTHFNDANGYILTNYGSGDAWSSPNPLYLRSSDSLAQVWGNNIWHSSNLPVQQGTYNPYPRGTGWTYTSEGKYYKQGKFVLVYKSRVATTTVGIHSVFELAGLPFTVEDFCWASMRIWNLQGLPSSYDFSCYVYANYLRPQYIHGTTATFSNMTTSQVTTATEVWFTAIYITND